MGCINFPLRQASSWCTARSSQLWGEQFGHGHPSQLWSATDQTFREDFEALEWAISEGFVGQTDEQTMIHDYLWLSMIIYDWILYSIP